MNSITFQELFQEEIYRLPPQPLIVIPVPWEKLSVEEVELLSKILKSIQVTINQVIIRTLDKIDCSSHDSANPKWIISFGPIINGVQTSYQVENLNGIRVIHSDALIDMDDRRKKALWTALKNLFL